MRATRVKGFFCSPQDWRSLSDQRQNIFKITKTSQFATFSLDDLDDWEPSQKHNEVKLKLKSHWLPHSPRMWNLFSTFYSCAGEQQATQCWARESFGDLTPQVQAWTLRAGKRSWKRSGKLNCVEQSQNHNDPIKNTRKLTNMLSPLFTVCSKNSICLWKSGFKPNRWEGSVPCDIFSLVAKC